MAPQKHFLGKRPFRDQRERKIQEIKKSLTHRARLRKNYFKLLEKEGLKEGHRTDDHRAEQQGDEENNSDDDVLETQNGDDKDKIDAPKSKYREKGSKPTKKAPTNFAERAQRVKENKEQKRKDKLQSIKDRREQIALKSQERELAKRRLTTRTKTGQPLMGPRINNLLDKIKKNAQ